MADTADQHPAVDRGALEELRTGVREVCDRLLRPGVAERDREGFFPEALVTELADAGFLSLTFPQRYGGLDLTPTEYVAVTEELGAADATARSMISVSVGLAGGILLAHGTDEQRERWLPEIAGGRLAALALTEPDAGSNPSELRSTATWADGSWRIRGSKMFITNGSTGVITLVFAQTRRDGESKGITCFIVPQDAPGYSTRKVGGKLGLRAGDTAEVFLDDVRVGPEDVVGEVGRGLRIVLAALDSGRVSVAAGAVGLAREALHTSIAYAGERKQFGRPIAGFQLIQAALSDSHVDVEAARGLVEHAAALKQAGERYDLAASTAKLFATEAAVRCANRAVQVHGGYGYVDDFAPARLLRDARVLTLYEGTSEIQRLLIGRALTGISAFT